MEKLGGRATLQELYQEIEGHAKTKTNNHWKEKIRQTLQIYDDFRNISRGIYELVSLGEKNTVAIA